MTGLSRETIDEWINRTRDDLGVLARYYGMSAEAVLSDAQCKVDEWSYNDDPHGYCHERSLWFGLIEQIAELTADRDKLRAAVNAAQQYIDRYFREPHGAGNAGVALALDEVRAAMRSALDDHLGES